MNNNITHKNNNPNIKKSSNENDEIKNNNEGGLFFGKYNEVTDKTNEEKYTERTFGYFNFDGNTGFTFGEESSDDQSILFNTNNREEALKIAKEEQQTLESFFNIKELDKTDKIKNNNKDGLFLDKKGGFVFGNYNEVTDKTNEEKNTEFTFGEESPDDEINSKKVTHKTKEKYFSDDESRLENIFNANNTKKREEALNISTEEQQTLESFFNIEELDKTDEIKNNNKDGLFLDKKYDFVFGNYKKVTHKTNEEKNTEYTFGEESSDDESKLEDIFNNTHNPGEALKISKKEQKTLESFFNNDENDIENQKNDTLEQENLLKFDLEDDFETNFKKLFKNNNNTNIENPENDDTNWGFENEIKIEELDKTIEENTEAFKNYLFEEIYLSSSNIDQETAENLADSIIELNSQYDTPDIKWNAKHYPSVWKIINTLDNKTDNTIGYLRSIITWLEKSTITYDTQIIIKNINYIIEYKTNQEHDSNTSKDEATDDEFKSKDEISIKEFETSEDEATDDEFKPKDEISINELETSENKNYDDEASYDEKTKSPTCIIS